MCIISVGITSPEQSFTSKCRGLRHCACRAIRRANHEFHSEQRQRRGWAHINQLFRVGEGTYVASNPSSRRTMFALVGVRHAQSVSNSPRNVNLFASVTSADFVIEELGS